MSTKYTRELKQKLIESLLLIIEGYIQYDKDAGKLYWKAKKAKNTVIGRECGSISSTTGYRRIKLDGTDYHTHQLIWLIENQDLPKDQLDHISGDKLDNRISNLQDVPQEINMRNRCISSNNTSGVTGVYWFKRTGQWRATIKVKGQTISLGYHDKFIDAVEARLGAEELYGFSNSHGRVA